MYDHETMTFIDSNLPHDEQLVDGYSTREVGNYWTQDYISMLSNAITRPELDHEPDLEQ